MGNTPSFIALTAVGVAVGLPLDQTSLLKSQKPDGSNGQRDIFKAIVTGLLLVIAALLAMYIYLAWKRREPAPPRSLYVAPQPLYGGGEAPTPLPSRQPRPPQSISMGPGASSSSSSPAHPLPPIRMPVKVVKAKTKINAPAVGDHYMNK